MPSARHAAAMRLLTDARYLDFQESYEGDADCLTWITDSPTVRIEIVGTANAKTITHYLGCKGFHREQELTRLEEELDKLFETRKYIYR
jgi:hypothetical protein